MVILTMTTTDYITQITVVVIVTMTGGHSNNDQTDYITKITDKVIVTMTGGHFNNNQTDYITQITDKVIITMTTNLNANQQSDPVILTMTMSHCFNDHNINTQYIQYKTKT